MIDKNPKEKVFDFCIAVVGMVLIFTCLVMLPKACETEAKMRAERTAAFLADTANDESYAARKLAAGE